MIVEPKNNGSRGCEDAGIGSSSANSRTQSSASEPCTSKPRSFGPIADSYDVIVMGAGPGGGTTAALVAQHGWKVLLVEREAVPRFHVGESLMPETYWTFERLGVLEDFKRIAFCKKFGVQFVSSDGKESRPFVFAEHEDRPSAETWHVERADFDCLLFDTAAKHGADCRDLTRVLDVRLAQSHDSSVSGGAVSEDGVSNQAGSNQAGSNQAGSNQGNWQVGDSDVWHTVELQMADGEKRSVRSRVVVDASGQQALIANRLGTKKVDPSLKKAAVWGHFENAQRRPDGEAEVTAILHTDDKAAWFWYIPLRDGRVSVGAVGDNDYMLKSGLSPEDKFEWLRQHCPGISRRLADANMVGSLRVAKEFSYTTSQRTGDGWVLVGDAYGFIDPVYSSGVYLALKSGQMAADAIDAGLRANDLSAETLGQWTAEFDAGVVWIRKLVHAFYCNEFSFGAFMKEHPHHGKNLTDLLVGKVFEGEPGKIFDDMDPWIERSKAMAAEKKMMAM